MTKSHHERDPRPASDTAHRGEPDSEPTTRVVDGQAGPETSTPVATGPAGTGAPARLAPSPADAAEAAPEGDRLAEMKTSHEKGKKKGKKKKKKKKKKKGLGSARGIETMFRTSYQTHNSLSALADTKANIMISINGIIISIMIASMAPAMGVSDRWLLLPLAVLLLGCLVSLVFAVLAARPRITHREVTVEDAVSGKANVLFFGNFVGMPEEDFVVAMKGLMGEHEQLYQNMIRDIYSLGGILERKFRLLRVSYTAFMIGLVLGVLLLLGGMLLA